MLGAVARTSGQGLLRHRRGPGRVPRVRHPSCSRPRVWTPPTRTLPSGAAAALATLGEAAWRHLPLPGRPPLTRLAYWVSSQECTIRIDKARARARLRARRRASPTASRSCGKCPLPRPPGPSPTRSRSRRAQTARPALRTHAGRPRVLRAPRRAGGRHGRPAGAGSRRRVRSPSRCRPLRRCRARCMIGRSQRCRTTSRNPAWVRISLVVSASAIENGPGPQVGSSYSSRAAARFPPRSSGRGRASRCRSSAAIRPSPAARRAQRAV